MFGWNRRHWAGFVHNGAGQVKPNHYLEILKVAWRNRHHLLYALRILRKGGLVRAARGKEGGYALARPPESIVIGDVIDMLGGRLFENNFCDSHAGQAAICTRSVDCSVRSLWRAVQVAVDRVLGKATLRDLLQNEEDMNSWVRSIPSGPSGLRLMQ